MFQTFTTALGLLAGLDPALWAIVGRSLAVSGCACALACLGGLPLGAWLAVRRFRGRAVVLALLGTALAVPSVLVGLVVYLLLSRSGPLGYLGWLYSFKAMVLAQALLVLPVVVALSHAQVHEAEQDHGEQLAAMGARPALRALLLAFDLRWPLLTVVITAFGRAVSEVGAVMVVGGNIDGFTRVMTTTIALETSKGDLPLALALGLVLLAVVLALHGAAALVLRWASRAPGAEASETAQPLELPVLQAAQISQTLGPLVALRQASLRYGAVQALAPCTLSVSAGERIAIIGANGSGKSSLLRLLGGVLAPSAGARSQAGALRSAFVFQRPWMLRASARANAALALWLGGAPWATASARAQQALAHVGLAAQAQQAAPTLSGGQQQRLALARAWSTQPQLLLLDEPSASLDPAGKKAVETLMAAFAQGGCALVFSSHNLGQVKRLASRVWFIHHGQLLVDLPVQAFFNGPLPPAAADFLHGEL